MSGTHFKDKLVSKLNLLQDVYDKIFKINDRKIKNMIPKEVINLPKIIKYFLLFMFTLFL
jgi:hypothetical protein